MIKQLTVQLPNSPGTLAGLIAALAGAAVDIKALGVSDRGEGKNGEASLIVNNLEKAKAALSASSHDFEVIEVIAVEMDDRVGGLSGILTLLSNEKINVSQIYAFVTRHTSKALAVIRVDDPVRAAELLRQGGLVVVDQKTIEKDAEKPETPTPLGEHFGLDFIW
jgi:hypothetical protein